MSKVNQKRRERSIVLLVGLAISIITFAIAASQPSWVSKVVLHGAYGLYLISGFPNNLPWAVLVNTVYYVLICFFCWNLYRRYRPLPPENPNACLACEYDLTGNESGTCPECGTANAPPSKTEVAS